VVHGIQLFIGPGNVFVDPSYLFFFSLSDAGIRGNHIRGGPLEIPGGRGRGCENSPKKIRAKKNAWKKIRQRKKNRASKQQSVNSLEKKFLQRLNPAETRD
jgi:hypothetical protein